MKTLTFIEHFAISPSMRCKGLGSKMLKEFISSQDLPIILEVELPEDEISLKRIKFYEKNRFKLNTYKYFQMPLRKSFLPKEMYLMSYPKSIAPEMFKEFQSAIYKTVYLVN